MSKSLTSRVACLLFARLCLLPSVSSSAVYGATDARIAERLRSLVAKPPAGATVAVFVERVDTGEVVFEHNPAEPMVPASNMKVLTTAAALSDMGRNFRYRTEVLARGTIRDDTLVGDLVVVGVGDPTFSARFSGSPGDLTWIFRDWARQIKERGVRRITGHIVGDDGAFDGVAAAPGWPESQGAEWYCAEVGALVFNDGCVDVTWRGAAKAGQKPSFTLNPPNGYINLVSKVETTTRVSRGSRWYQRTDEPNVINVSGTIRPGQSSKDFVSVSGATRFFASCLRETLMTEGIEIAGRGRDIDEYEDKSPFRKRLKRLAYYDSPPLADIVHQTNLHSQNLFAEMLLKKLGERASGVGSFESGAAAVLAFLERHGAPTEGMRLIDGSGLSRENRVTVQALVATLRAMDASDSRASYRVSFPVGGISGSLRKRFAASSQQRRDANRVVAKTGYIRGVRALSGWVAREDESEYRFSVLLNSGKSNAPGALPWIDSVAMALAQP